MSLYFWIRSKLCKKYTYGLVTDTGIICIIIFIGLQASGKSTFYNEYFKNYIHINLDTLHTRNKEKILLDDCIKKELSFVIDNTNPTAEDRERYIEFAKDNGYKLIGYYFQSSVSECLERNNLREGKAKVPDVAVLGTYKKIELPSKTEGFDELYYVYIKDGKFSIEDWKEGEQK